MTRVPRTVPSTPLLFMRSSRQIMRNDPAMNRPTNQRGAHPVLSIHVINGSETIPSPGIAGTIKVSSEGLRTRKGNLSDLSDRFAEAALPPAGKCRQAQHAQRH